MYLLDFLFTALPPIILLILLVSITLVVIDFWYISHFYRPEIITHYLCDKRIMRHNKNIVRQPFLYLIFREQRRRNIFICEYYCYFSFFRLRKLLCKNKRPQKV